MLAFLTWGGNGAIAGTIDPQAPPPGGGQTGNTGPNRPREPDLAAVAQKLNVTEDVLRRALGPPPPDLRAAATKLGIGEIALRRALGVP